MIGRKKPYTTKGLKRILCACCKKQKARFQWTACAINSRYVPVCTDCDIHLNILLVTAFGTPNGPKLLKKYAEAVKSTE